MQDLFQCGALHLKFSYVSPDFKGGISSSCVIIQLLMGEEESLFIFPLPDFFFPGLFLKTESQQRGMKR